MKIKGRSIAVSAAVVLGLMIPAMASAQGGMGGTSGSGGMGGMGGASPTQPNQNPMQQPRMNNPTDGGDAGMTGQAMIDKIFLHNVAEGGLLEVQLGQLAAEKGSSEEVKSLGQRMVDDHTMLNNEMMPIARQMGVMAPKKLNKKDQAEYDKLNGMSGEDFDKEYLSCMVKDHHVDLMEFRREMASTQDQGLKAAVTRGVQMIQLHAQMVDSLAESKGVAVSKKDEKMR